MGNSAKSLFCKEFTELAQLVIDNEASEEELTRFLSFINSCSDCAEYFDSEKSTIEFIKCRAGKSSPPASLADEIRNKVYHFV